MSEVQQIVSPQLSPSDEVQEIYIGGTGSQLQVQEIMARVQHTGIESNDEVQRILTMVNHVHEIQTITVGSTMVIPEVQGIYIMSLKGAPIPLHGIFRINFGYYTGRYVNVGATADEIIYSLSDVPFLKSGVFVSAVTWESEDLEGMYYEITITQVFGDVTQLVVDSSGLFGTNITIWTEEVNKGEGGCEVQEVTILGVELGTFSMLIDGIGKTEEISWNATSDELFEVISVLPGIGRIYVTKTSPPSVTTTATLPRSLQSWTIAFPDQGIGFGLLSINEILLEPSSTSMTRVWRLSQSQSILPSGSFVLSLNTDTYQNETTSPISVDASSSVIEDALLNLESLSGRSIIVSSEHSALSSSYFQWSITFPPGLDWPLLTGNFIGESEELSMSDYIAVFESRKGTSDDVFQVTSGDALPGDTWRFELEGRISNPVPHDVSQAQILSELENIGLLSAEVITLPTGSGDCTGQSNCNTWEIRLPPTDCIGVDCPLLVARGDGLPPELGGTHSGTLNVRRIAQATLTPISSRSFVLDGLDILYDVSEEKLGEALYPLHGTVAVTRTSTGPLNSYTWDITFKDRRGDIPLLELNLNDDMQKSSSGEVSALIEEVNKGTGPCCVTGEFHVFLESSVGDDESALLTIGSGEDGDDREMAISMALSNLLNSHPNISMFGSTNTSYVNLLDGGFVWRVTFLDSAAPLPPPLFYIINTATVINGTATANVVSTGERSEVQRVEILASSDIIQANFTLSLNGKVTSPMDATVVSDEVLEQAFINELGVLVKVAALNLHTASGYAWDIIFEGAAGGTQGQVVSCSFSGNTIADFTDDVTCNSYLMVESSSQPLDGVFVLEFDGEETVPLTVNPAPLPQDIGAALTELSGIASVDITGGSEVDGIRYQITFTGSSVSSGDVPLLGFGEAGTTLNGTGVTASVTELNACCRGGEGRLWSIGLGSTISPLPFMSWNTSSDVVAQAIEAIPGIGRVSVTDDLWYNPEHQQYRSWLVTFVERKGNMGLLQATYSDNNSYYHHNSSGDEAAVLFSVDRVQNGTIAVRGYWSISFDSSPASAELSWDESAIEL